MDTVMAAQRRRRATAPCTPAGALARDIFEDVYKKMPPHLRRQRQQMGV